MNEEKRLQQLKEIQVVTAKKERDFQEITARINRKKSHWQVPAAVIGVLCIIIFLVASMPKQQMITSEADEEPHLVAIYKVSGEGNPSSKWRMGVDEFTEEKELSQMEDVIAGLILVEKSIPNYAIIKNTYRLNYDDGSSKVFAEYGSASGSYFYDKTDDIIYSVGENAEIPYLWDYKSNNGFFIFIILILASDWFIGRKMRDPNDKERRIPRHSTEKQSIVTIVLLVATGVIIFVVPNIHFFYIVCVASLLAAINIILETYYGNNFWRKVNFLISSIWLIGIFYFIIL